jgi:DNA-binding HxlR family transcriptional regulator
MPKKKSLAELNCSLAHALDIVGDGWTLLILRDLFLGATRFADLAQSLGIARNILTDRLARLIREGLIERRGADARPHYFLTEKGWELVPPLVGILQWGDRYYAPDGSPIEIVDAGGDLVAPLAVENRDGRRLIPRELFAVPGPGAEPRTRRYIEAVGTARRSLQK